MMEVRLATLHEKRDAYDAKISDLEARISKYKADDKARSELAAEDEVIAKIMAFGEDDVEELKVFKDIYKAYANVRPCWNDDGNSNADGIMAPTEARDIYLSQEEIARRYAEKEEQRAKEKAERENAEPELSLDAAAKVRTTMTHQYDSLL